ncbi:MAG: ATP-binding protein [Lachnospiraceae bacterium]|nr:ATP-binding protein [Lachnospiraceae bacterium]
MEIGRNIIRIEKARGGVLMYRKFYQTLEQWEEQQIKEPLLVVGARQVGKTWIIKEFCKNRYENYKYLNFESMKGLDSVFEESLEPETILENLEILTGEKIGKDTLLFFDEIQKSERAITALKYFCEADYNYRVIGAGSLLGVKLNRFETSFPVGKVRIEKMYPMDFEEFLIAMGEDKLITKIKDHTMKMSPMPEAFHNKALELYRHYLYVGGMPQCVADFSVTKNVMDFDRQLQANILLAYTADMKKYTLSVAEGIKIEEVYHSIPRQLAKENPKFKYKEVRPHANKRDFYLPLDWLRSSMLIYKVAKVELPQSPLRTYTDENIFKIYLSDVGLLAYEAGVSYRDLLPESDNMFKGILTENYVIQQMNSAGWETFYYKPDASMEIDVLLDNEGDIIPIEIKSGRHIRSTSLKNYCEKYSPVDKIRLSYRNFGISDTVRSVPVYAFFALLDHLLQ